MSSVPLPQRLVGPEAFHRLPALLARMVPSGAMPFLVCDVHTWQAAAPFLTAITPEAALWPRHYFPTSPKASNALALDIARAAGEAPLLIALGSGTLNDLTKYAAAQLNKPYCVIATAASMNGYTAANASLLDQGFKHSFPANPPVAVIADGRLLATAPARMARAGFADTLCRSTVEADMRLSHALLGSPLPEDALATLRAHEPGLLDHAPALRSDDPAALLSLMDALLDAGDAMTRLGSSAVASQGEHMIAHTLEMLAPEINAPLLHGEVIALTTLTMRAHQEKLLATSARLRSPHLGAFPDAFASCQAGYHLKQTGLEKITDGETRLHQYWPTLQTEIARYCLDHQTLKAAFETVGLGLRPAMLGIDPALYTRACSLAHLTRDRFTFLDIVAKD